MLDLTGDRGPVVCSNVTDVVEDFNAIDPEVLSTATPQARTALSRCSDGA
jgi:hypothetical protein